MHPLSITLFTIYFFYQKTPNHCICMDACQRLHCGTGGVRGYGWGEGYSPILTGANWGSIGKGTYLPGGGGGRWLGTILWLSVPSLGVEDCGRNRHGSVCRTFGHPVIQPVPVPEKGPHWPSHMDLPAHSLILTLGQLWASALRSVPPAGGRNPIFSPVLNPISPSDPVV
uniref:Uncharacterized protein n=1 Tax=Xenopus tropicalis TaxID=8364 RepID=A0A1B8Y4C3_XENTR